MQGDRHRPKAGVAIPVGWVQPTFLQSFVAGGLHPPFYEKRRSVKSSALFFSRLVESFFRWLIDDSGWDRSCGASDWTPHSRLLQKNKAFPAEQRRGKGWGVWGAGTGATGPAPQGSPPTVVPQNSSFCSGVFCLPRQRLDHKHPLPEAELGLVFRCSSRPRGSSFYGGSDAPLVTSSDDGLGTWRPILRESGPLPARMGAAAARHVDPLDLQEPVLLPSVRFRRLRPWQESVPRRRTPRPP